MKKLPEEKVNALLLATPNISPEINLKKNKAFQSQIKFHAALSATVAAVPVPGLSIAVDLGLLVSVVTTYYYAFGIDNKSLETLASKTGVAVEELKNACTSPFKNISTVNTQLIIKLLSSSASYIAKQAAEEGLRFIPFVGTLIAASLSFQSTYNMLTTCLDMLMMHRKCSLQH